MWVSRTGWTTSTDTVAFLNAAPITYTSDHFGESAPGAYKIFKNGWTLTESSTVNNHTGDAYLYGDMTNMPEFGTAMPQVALNGEFGAGIDRTLNDDTTNAYGYVRINMKPAYAGTAKVSRALRYLVHLKKTGTQDYVIAYDDLLSTTGNTKRVALLYDKQPTNTGVMTSATLPSLVWTGTNRRVSTTVVLPTGANAVIATPLMVSPYAYQEPVCISADGVTCDTANTSGEFLVVHRPSASTSDTMPTVGLISSDARYRVVQIDGTDPKVAAFPKAGASGTSVAFTSTHFGTAQVLVTGLAPGSYLFKRNGATVCSQAVDTNGALYCESASGSITVVEAGSTG
jgi:hypothetical protein